MTRTGAVLLAGRLGVSAALLACGRDTGPAATPASDVPETPSTPPAPSKPAVLTGRVKLAPGATLPSYRIEDMERQVLDHIRRGAWPESCTPPKNADRQPVALTSDGYLAGVMLAASEFAHPSTRAPKVHEAVIRDCRLTPALVVAMRGDKLRVRNEIEFPFMPTYGRAAMVQTLTPGQTRDYGLEDMGVGAVQCGFTAPCGRTDVIVLGHPAFAITDTEGRFRIEDFPPAETIRVNAWHPLFAEAQLEVRVERGETREVELTLAPLPPAAAPAAASGSPSASGPAGESAPSGASGPPGASAPSGRDAAGGPVRAGTK